MLEGGQNGPRSVALDCAMRTFGKLRTAKNGKLAMVKYGKIDEKRYVTMNIGLKYRQNNSFDVGILLPMAVNPLGIQYLVQAKLIVIGNGRFMIFSTMTLANQQRSCHSVAHAHCHDVWATRMHMRAVMRIVVVYFSYDCCFATRSYLRVWYVAFFRMICYFVTRVWQLCF